MPVNASEGGNEGDRGCLVKEPEKLELSGQQSSRSQKLFLVRQVFPGCAIILTWRGDGERQGTLVQANWCFIQTKFTTYSAIFKDGMIERTVPSFDIRHDTTALTRQST